MAFHVQSGQVTYTLHSMDEVIAFCVADDDLRAQLADQPVDVTPAGQYALGTAIGLSLVSRAERQDGRHV